MDGDKFYFAASGNKDNGIFDECFFCKYENNNVEPVSGIGSRIIVNPWKQVVAYHSDKNFMDEIPILKQKMELQFWWYHVILIKILSPLSFALFMLIILFVKE